MKIPPDLQHWSLDKVAERLSVGEGISRYLWELAVRAERDGTAKPAGGDGSDGTFEEPVITSGEYGTDLAAHWDNLPEPVRAGILEAWQKEKGGRDV